MIQQDKLNELVSEMQQIKTKMLVEASTLNQKLREFSKLTGFKYENRLSLGELCKIINLLVEIRGLKMREEVNELPSDNSSQR